MNSVEHKGVWSGMEWEKRAKTVNTNELNWRKRTTQRKADRWYECLCIVWDAYRCLVMVESIGNFFGVTLNDSQWWTVEQLKKIISRGKWRKSRDEKTISRAELSPSHHSTLDARHSTPSPQSFHIIHIINTYASFSPGCEFFFNVLIVCLFHLFIFFSLFWQFRIITFMAKSLRYLFWYMYNVHIRRFRGR